jgi:hypothetical protein
VQEKRTKSRFFIGFVEPLFNPIVFTGQAFSQGSLNNSFSLTV